MNTHPAMPSIHLTLCSLLATQWNKYDCFYFTYTKLRPREMSNTRGMAGNRNYIVPPVVPNLATIPPFEGNIIWRQFWWLQLVCVCVCVCVCVGLVVILPAFSRSATKHPTVTGQLPTTQHFLTLNVSCAMVVNFRLYLKGSDVL